MYKRILLAVDNSEHSRYALDSAIQLAKAFSSTLVGIHVYAARLHDARFVQLEPGLPPRYGKEELDHQREVHNSLIGLGLGLISDSYLDVFSERCQQEGVQAERRMREGRNFVEILHELASGDYDLVILGALGLGRVRSSLIGSVCERVARAARCDVLVARGSSISPGGKLLVGIDGSGSSFAALRTALTLGIHLRWNVEAVAVFDPFFHTAAFGGVKKVLSEEAGKIFRFSDQERLHDEIINQGLSKLYEGHLKRATAIAAGLGVELETRLLEGKPFEAIAERVRQEEPLGKPWMLAVGRYGFHNVGTVNIGSNAENLLRIAACDVLICSQGM